MRAYANYIENVLGVPSLMMDLPVVTPGNSLLPAFFVGASGDIKKPLEQHFSLVVLNWTQSPSQSLFQGEVQELTQKMLAALKLPPGQVLAVDCVMNERPLIPAEAQKFFNASAVLMFASEPEALSKIQIKGGFHWLETFSPAYLLENPDAKRIVWNDMQKILKEVN